MLKILTTQLQGLFQRLGNAEEENIEDTARLLAQAAIGEGYVYFACFGEFEAVYTHASKELEPFAKVRNLTNVSELTPADRVCIFTPLATDEAAIALAATLSVPFAVVASENKKNPSNTLFEEAYTYVNLHVRGGLIPSETGERLVQPDLFAALFAYEAIKLSYDEMLAGE
ncbi:MAG TPA: DUF2529 family protein [Metalysinibacillus sp.]